MLNYEKMYRDLNEDVRKIIKDLEYVLEKSERPIFEEFRNTYAERVQTVNLASLFKPNKKDDK